MRTVTIVCLILCVQPMLTSAATPLPDNPHFWNPRTRSVAVFKNGFGFFLREGGVTTRDGWAVAREIPPAAFGTLAIYSLQENEMVDIVGAGPGELVEFDGRDAPDQIEARRGRLAGGFSLIDYFEAIAYAIGSKRGIVSFPGTSVRLFGVCRVSSRAKGQIRIRSISLRGLGSYLNGAILHLHPLTVLCGTNGSGKSTWFKMLNLLTRSLDEGLLPFHFSTTDNDPAGNDSTNAAIRLLADEIALIEDQHDEYGPPGTIGLIIEAERDLSLNSTVESSDQMLDATSLPIGFLWHGLIPAGTTFRLRIAHPTNYGGGTSSTFQDLVELVVNNTYVLRFQRQLSGDEMKGGFFQLNKDGDRLTRDDPYIFSCSAAFLPGHAPHDLKLLDLATTRGDDQFTALNDWCESTSLGPLCNNVVQRFRDLLARALSTYFYIGAVRLPEQRPSIEESGSDNTVARRYVGSDGSNTHELERAFAHNIVEQQDSTRSSNRFSIADIHDPFGVCELLSDKRTLLIDPQIDRIRQIATPALSQALGTRGIRDRLSREECATITADILNNVLTSRDLYDANCWPSPGDEAESLIQRGIDSLSSSEVQRLNRLLVEAAFNKKGYHQIIEHAPPLWFETYVSCWLSHLVDVRFVKTGDGDWDAISDWHLKRTNNEKPLGYLRDFSPNPQTWLPPGQTEDCDADQNPLSLERLKSGPLGGPHSDRALPRRMSSGFHQIAPIVVQAALMRPSEVLALENPEVHLHPKAQLDITEFLIQHALTGRFIIIETHSDLVIRRIIREVLTEDMHQEAVRIYFTRLQEAPRGYQQSTIEALKVDDMGQVANWPPGFLDEDIKESRRLFEIMYGLQSDDDNEWD